MTQQSINPVEAAFNNGWYLDETTYPIIELPENTPGKPEGTAIDLLTEITEQYGLSTRGHDGAIGLVLRHPEEERDHDYLRLLLPTLVELMNCTDYVPVEIVSVYNYAETRPPVCPISTPNCSTVPVNRGPAVGAEIVLSGTRTFLLTDIFDQHQDVSIRPGQVLWFNPRVMTPQTILSPDEPSLSLVMLGRYS